MNVRPLSRDDFDILFDAFCLAFSSNKVQFELTKEEFEFRIHSKLVIDYDLSGAMFDGDNLIAFILHTSNMYEGIPTAFNAGTGVVPGFRNQRSGEELYDYLLPRIAAKSIPRVLLEVIDTNDRAIRLYEKLGFTFRRHFFCYKLSSDDYSAQQNVHIGTLEDVNEGFADFEPAFADSKAQLLRGNERVLVAKKEDQPAGYLVFQPQMGRVSQIAVSRIFRNEGVGRSLIHTAASQSSRRLTIMNVPDNEIGFQKFLLQLGFENQVNQFEMELII